MSDVDNSTPDFSNPTPVSNTDAGPAINTISAPDFSNSVPLETAPTVPKKIGVMSKVVQFILNQSPIQQFKNSLYMQEHDLWPDPVAGEDITDYQKRAEEALKPHLQEEAGKGVGHLLEDPMKGAIAVGAVTAPVLTAGAVLGGTVLDKFVNLRRFSDKHFPNTSADIRDIIDITDIGLKAAILGGGFKAGEIGFKNVKDFIVKRNESLGIPNNVNIPADKVSNVADSINLLPEEKADMAATLGVTADHLEAARASGLPLNVPADKVMDLTIKPYWDRAKPELLGEQPKVQPENAPDLKDLQGLIAQKDLSIATMTKLKKFMSIDNIKNATPEQIKQVTGMVGDLKAGEKFLSEKQNAALDEILKPLENKEVTPKSIIVERFGEKEAILSEGIMSKVMPELVPTVNIKQGHPLITKIVNNARDLFNHAESEVSRRNKNFDKMVTAAEKSREKLLTPQEKISRAITPQNDEIFQSLSGNKVELTKEEAATVAYLRNFFAKAREDLALDKYRKNYVTHLEQSLTEKILDKGLIPAIKEILNDKKEMEISTDLMLELDNIIGSEKFFKFALERKGGITPTTNLRQIVNAYSNLYETKMALDKILPEGQAVTQTLLKGKSAVWMKRFLQNLKGRGLDNSFKTGPMGWLAKVADGIVDIGYIKLLGLNWMSALKNVVAGEANSWIYQDFPSYIKGKQRFISDPKKSYELAKEFGILDGTYADYAQKGIGSLKKLQDATMIGQRVGEIEVRGSILTAMMTDKEWASGEMSKARVNEIKDVIAKTQGIFSKVDSPLVLQTWYGRMFFQMNRWRITNALLMHDITVSAAKDMKEGKYNTQNVTRLGKMVVAYGVGMYVANEFYKNGYKKAGDVAKNMAQTIDGVAALVTDGDLVKMFTDNPTLSTLKEFSNTLQNTAVYLNVPGAKSTKEKGIEDTYIAPVKTAEDILNEVQ